MLNKDNPKTVSILVCFAGKNRRVEINPKKCVTNPNHDFSYSAQYKADDGKLYMVKVVSIPDTKGAKADVTITRKVLPLYLLSHDIPRFNKHLSVTLYYDRYLFS